MSNVDLLTTAEAATFLRRKAATLRNWRSLHRGPPYVRMQGGAIFYKRAELEAWVPESLHQETHPVIKAIDENFLSSLWGRLMDHGFVKLPWKDLLQTGRDNFRTAVTETVLVEFGEEKR